MTILDTVESKEQSPEILLRSGMITHDEYIELKKKEKYKDGRRI